MPSKNKSTIPVTVSQLCDKSIPPDAQIMLFGKTCKLQSIVFMKDKLYEVSVPADIGEGSVAVHVSAEHEVLTGVKVKSVEEVAAEAEKEAERLKKVEEDRVKAVEDKKAADLLADREKAKKAAEDKVKAEAAKKLADSNPPSPTQPVSRPETEEDKRDPEKPTSPATQPDVKLSETSAKTGGFK